MELRPLVPAATASDVARAHAQSFNDDVAAIRAALLEPAQGLVGRGASVAELAACLERSVAQLAFWRRVLLGIHGAQLGTDAPSSDYLVRWLTR